VPVPFIRGQRSQKIPIKLDKEKCLRSRPGSFLMAISNLWLSAASLREKVGIRGLKSSVYNHNPNPLPEEEEGLEIPYY
jgi:hypothetical protein